MGHPKKRTDSPKQYKNIMLKLELIVIRPQSQPFSSTVERKAKDES
jgi:hypothetical protein